MPRLAQVWNRHCAEHSFFMDFFTEPIATERNILHHRAYILEGLYTFCLMLCILLLHWMSELTYKSFYVVINHNPHRVYDRYIYTFHLPTHHGKTFTHGYTKDIYWHITYIVDTIHRNHCSACMHLLPSHYSSHLLIEPDQSHSHRFHYCLCLGSMWMVLWLKLRSKKQAYTNLHKTGVFKMWSGLQNGLLCRFTRSLKYYALVWCRNDKYSALQFSHRYTCYLLQLLLAHSKCVLSLSSDPDFSSKPRTSCLWMKS